MKRPVPLSYILFDAEPSKNTLRIGIYTVQRMKLDLETSFYHSQLQTINGLSLQLDISFIRKREETEREKKEGRKSSYTVMVV